MLKHYCLILQVHLYSALEKDDRELFLTIN